VSSASPSSLCGSRTGSLSSSFLLSPSSALALPRRGPSTSSSSPTPPPSRAASSPSSSFRALESLVECSASPSSRASCSTPGRPWSRCRASRRGSCCWACSWRRWRCFTRPSSRCCVRPRSSWGRGWGWRQPQRH